MISKDKILKYKQGKTENELAWALIYDEDNAVVNTYRALQEKIRWDSTLSSETAGVIPHQCKYWFPFVSQIRSTILSAISLETLNKMEIISLVDTGLSQISSYWHNFMLVFMRKTIYELLLLLRYKEGLISEEQFIQEMKSMDVSHHRIKGLLKHGSKYYDYHDKWDSAYRKGCNQWEILGYKEED